MRPGSHSGTASDISDVWRPIFIPTLAHVIFALGADSFNVTISQEALVCLAIQLLVLVFLEPPVLVKFEEDVLADPARGESSVQ